MKKKYRVKNSFTITINGAPRMFAADKVYELNLRDLPKHNRGSFIEIIEVGAVEAATAAPGEKRAVGRPRKVEEPVEEPADA